MLTAILIAFLAVQLGLPLVLHLVRDRLIFLPSRQPEPKDGLDWIGSGVAAELVYISRPDGRQLAAYDGKPAPRPTDEPAEATSPVVLFFHGNAGNLASRAGLFGDLVRGLRSRVLLFDYTGYGGNAGTPSENEINKDGLAAFDYLVDTGADPSQIVVYGESLGGSVALAVASRRPCAGVVLQSSFSSLSSMARRLYPWFPLGSVLARGAYPNARRAASLTAPLLLVHGTDDEIVPYSESEILLRSAPPGTDFWAIEGADHNDLFAVAGLSYLRRLDDRLHEWVRAD